jgi:hypothetical protein
MSLPTHRHLLALRHRLGIAAAILAPLFAAACAPSGDASPSSGTDEGADAAASASPDAGSQLAADASPANADAAPPLTARQLEVARMQAHLDSLYAQADVVHRFTTALGDGVDCVPFQKQPGYAQVGSVSGAPPVLAAQSLGFHAAAVAGFGDGADASGNVRACPPGAVPIRRLTIAELARFATLEDFLAKTPSRAIAPNGSAVVGPDAAIHEHAVYQSSVANWGGQTTINLWTPAVDSQTFSLSQLWVVRGTDANLQSVEAGYTADRFRHADDADSRLFIYSTTDNYVNASPTGCYDLTCKAFVQLPDTHVLLGGKFDKSSIFDGEQREFTLRWQFCPATECQAWEGWWLRYDGGATSEWVGFYPRARYSGSGLHDQGGSIDFGGEVAFFSGGSHPMTDMGSGQIGSAGFGRAAYHTNLLRITPEHSWASFDSLLMHGAEAPSCYDTGALVTPGRVPTRLFYFGGNGFSEVCK